MFLAPSSIHYITSKKINIIPQTLDQSIIDLSRKIIQNGDMPKVQVVEKGGHWFTLNNAQLDLCKKLEHDGACKKVKVDIVPLSDIPEDVRQMMTLSPTQPESKSITDGGDNSRRTGKGYQKLDQADTTEVAEASSDSDAQSSSDESEFGDSESECDWSDDDADSSDANSSDGEADSTEDENEKLL